MRSWFLALLLLILGLMGVLTLRSVAPGLAAQQLLYVLVGVGLFGVLGRWSYRDFLRWRWWGYLALCVLLCIPLLIGKTTRGIAAWIDIGTWFSIQPSQLAIPAVGLLLSHRLAHFRPNWRHLAETMVLIGIPGVLIALEPDLGTLVVYMVSMMSMVFISQVRWEWMAMMLVLAITVALTGWAWWLKPYQKARITSFMTGADAQGASYNARQALIAVGSGQLVGRGLGQGIQSHLRFLPERQTDFIFASLAEELGLIGAGAVLFCYGAMVIFAIAKVSQTGNSESIYYAFGVASMIVTQVGINVGMNMSIVPITGITLPMVSYGGSSIIGVCLMLGLIQSSLREEKVSQSLHLT